MDKDKRKQILYQKTEFNSHLICQLPTILKCCRCKRNNNIISTSNLQVQLCLFCGTPNYIKK